MFSRPSLINGEAHWASGFHSRGSAPASLPVIPTPCASSLQVQHTSSLTASHPFVVHCSGATASGVTPTLRFTIPPPNSWDLSDSLAFFHSSSTMCWKQMLIKSRSDFMSVAGMGCHPCFYGPIINFHEEQYFLSYPRQYFLISTITQAILRSWKTDWLEQGSVFSHKLGEFFSS